MKSFRRALAPAVSVLILGAIFFQIDLKLFADNFAAMDIAWFAMGLASFVPIFWIRAIILRRLFENRLGIRDALRCTLAASSLNAVLPSKAGDIAKGFFVRQHLKADLPTCMATVILERILDISALVTLLFIGLAVINGEVPYMFSIVLAAIGILGVSLAYFGVHLFAARTNALLAFIGRLPAMDHLIDASLVVVKKHVYSGRIVSLFAMVLFLWILHIVQFYCFFQTLGYDGPWTSVFALVPAAVFVGLLPITIAGFGTRDLALIVLFAPWASPELAAGVGILSHLRYILPAIVGSFAAHGYFAATAGPPPGTGNTSGD